MATTAERRANHESEPANRACRRRCRHTVRELARTLRTANAHWCKHLRLLRPDSWPGHQPGSRAERGLHHRIPASARRDGVPLLVLGPYERLRVGPVRARTE